MDETVKIEVSGRIDGSIAQSLRDIAVAALEANSNLELFRKAVQDLSSDNFRRASQDATLLATEMQAARKSSDELKAAIAANTEAIAGNTKAVTDLTSNVDKLGVSQQRASKETSALTSLIGRAGYALGAAFSVQKITKYSSSWVDLNARVGLAVGSMEKAPEVMNRISDMARRTYSGLEQTAEAFLLNSTSLRELGYSTDQTLDYVEALNNALVVSGAKGQRATTMMEALSKAMALGELRGQNLNTVIMQGGRITELLAETLGVSTNELRKLGEQGLITGEVINKALVGNLDKLRDEADRMAATIEDAFVILDNALLRVIGTFMDVSGASSGAAAAIIFLADNIEFVAGAIGLFGAAWAALKIVDMVRSIYMLTAAFVALNTTVALWIVGIVAAVAAALALGYAWEKLNGSTETFEQYLGKTVKTIGDFVGKLTDTIMGADDTSNSLSSTDKIMQGLGVSTKSTAGSIGAMTKATNDNAAAAKSWSSSTVKSVNAVTNAYRDLAKAKAAAGEGVVNYNSETSKAAYDSLQAAGGAKGSFTAVAPPTAGAAASIVELKGYRNGGSFKVGGGAGVDKNLVAFRATRGEQVDITTPSQQRAVQNQQPAEANHTTIIQITTPDIQNFRRSRSQIAADVMTALGR